MVLRKDQLHRANLNYYLFGESQADISDMFIITFSTDDNNKLNTTVTAWEIDRHGNVKFKNLNTLTSFLDIDKHYTSGIIDINHKAHIIIDKDEYDDEVIFDIGSRVYSTFNIYNSNTKTVTETTISRHPITVDFTPVSINNAIMIVNFPYATSAPIIRIYEDIDLKLVNYIDKYIIDGKDKDKLFKFDDSSDNCRFNSTLIEHRIKTQEIKIINDMNIVAMDISTKLESINKYLSTTDINYDFAVESDTRYTMTSKSVNGLNTKSEVGTDKYITKLFYKDELIEGVESDEKAFSTVFGMTVNKNDASEIWYIDEECTALDPEDDSTIDAKNTIVQFLEEYFDIDESEYEFKFYIDKDGRIFVSATHSAEDASDIMSFVCRIVKDKYLYIQNKKVTRDGGFQSLEMSYILIDLEESSEIFTEYHYNIGGVDNCKYNDSTGYLYTSSRSYRMEENNKVIVNQKYSAPELSFDIDFDTEGKVIKINSFNSLIYNYNDQYVVIRDSYGIPNLLFINI